MPRSWHGGLGRGTSTQSRSARLIAHLDTPLYRNGYALLLSSATTSGLGVVYWILAARAYTIDTVGLNSAAISAMMFLAGVSQLNLMSALLRFIPGAGRVTGRFVLSTYLISAAVALIISLIFLGGLGLWAPRLSVLNSNPIFTGWFTVATMAWCVFVLQDSVLTGLRQATWVPVENTAFGLAKIALLIGLASLLPRYGVFASWTIALIITLLPVNLLIFRRLIPRHSQTARDDHGSLAPTQVIKYVAGDYVGSLCWLASTTLLPVMVTQQAGPTAGAYFFLSWQLAYSLYLISPNMGASLIVEAATDPAQLGTYSYRIFVQTARVVVPAAVLVMLGAPYILGIFGATYATEGTALLRLLALSAIPNVVTSLFISVARVQRHVAAIVAVLASLCALVVTLSYILLPTHGIAGVGLAWLISQTLIAMILLPVQLRPLWLSGLRAASQTRDHAIGPPPPPILPAPAPTGSTDEQCSILACTKQLGAFTPAPHDRASAVTVSSTAPIPAPAQNRAIHVLTVARGATGQRLLPIFRRAVQYPRRRRSVAVGARLLPALLPAVAPLPSAPPPRTWTCYRLVPTVSDMTVILIGPPENPPVAVLKLPRTGAAVTSLGRQTRALTTLHADSRLGAWRALLPVILAEGLTAGHAYAVEQMLPGRGGRDLLANPMARARMQAAAAAAIGELHRRTAIPSVVTSSMLDRWVDAPLRTIRHVMETFSHGSGGSAGAIERLSAELHQTLADRTLCVSFVHGDFTPDNVLMTPDGAIVTGIVDWELAAVDELPLLDLLLLLLSSRMLAQYRELGAVMRDLLAGARWTPGEQALIDAAESALPGDTIPMRTLLLLCWMRHVAANLTKADRYASHRRWIARNVDAVLQCL